MTDQEIKIREMEERIHKLEDRVNELALQQYEPEYDISEEPLDPEPYVPVAACSQEAMYEAMREHKEWEERQNNFKGKFTIN